ncbi:hypothetical protein QTJ16_002381 [Diplocarpon rosae]|uniref:SH3 domain-containing protein n=1 Tax=Diplocarpon rosae TaxID=946125 RepID=A0AAD9WDX4_9HELO|nr:hypothetical protein QTJ16_002381 [Diplocarpon rosae]
MREDFLEPRHDSTICFSQASNVSVDLIRSLGEAALQGSAMPAQRRGQGRGPSTRKQRSIGFKTRAALLSALATAPGAIAQSCISLSGSTQCPAFTSASISTDSTLIGLLYAEFAQSEAIVVADDEVCSNPSANVESQIRADFTNCALPAKSLAGSCIDGATNEPENCGFGNSTTGLCSIAGLVLLVTLIFLLIFCIRRRRGSQASSVFNQPSPAHKGQTPGMAYNPAVASNDATPEGYEVLPGGRIARMSALEGHSGGSPPRGGGLSVTGAEAAEAAGGYDLSRRRNEQSSSDEYSVASQSNGVGVLRPPPTGRRAGSLSSSSVLGLDDPQSPTSGSGGDISSPLGLTSQQSEQLPFFKDYYSQDEIHPGDKVATLWAYQPRASDEFALERGDMLKVIGIWDDGWATGLMTDDRASEWDAKRNAQRDSGVSNTSGRRNESPPTSGEIKAFPLVCVCLPDHWRKTIEGDGSTEAGSSAPAGIEQ